MEFEDEIGGDAVTVGPVFNTRLKPPVARTREQQLLDAVVLAAEVAHRQGLPVDTPAIVLQNGQLTPHQVDAVLATSKLRRALEDRGIPLGQVGGLTGVQANFLRIYFDPDIKADSAKRLRIAGVTRAQLDGWLRSEAFNKEYTRIANQLLRDTMPVARQRVAMGIEAGKLDYIKFGMELTGEYDPRGGPTVDVMAFGRAMLDVIAQEVGDQEVIRRIGARMQLVLQNRPSDLPLAVEAPQAVVVQE
jgi:hypothetical protein